MYSTVTKTNAFFRDASRPQVDELMKNLVLTERQAEIFELYYIKRHDRGFVADKLFVSQSTVSAELRSIRLKLVKFL